MSIKKYFKRGIKYLLYEHKPKIVYVRPGQINFDNILKDKVVLITGGSDGIGLSIAKRFDEQGAKVIITGRNEEKLKSAINSMKNATYFKNDIALVNTHSDLLKFVYDRFSKLDILINNAGISNHEKDFLTVSEKDFDSQFNTNIKGGYFLTQSIIKHNLEVGGGLNIIFITSERGDQCDFVPYGLTKAAINSLIKGLSCRFCKDDIRVNGIAPGVTASKMTKIKKEDDLYTDHYISGRFFVPEEVAEIALFLASEYSKCISGEIIHCNSGNHLNSYF